jgi:16S rRNA (guanine966-N2)-methyltransferase
MCSVRITGGSLRSRRLVAPKGDLTRPTTDRVREALFSALGSRGAMHEGARVLDLYAGTGALSFEAISRGASFATLVDKDRAAAAAIKANAQELGVSRQIQLLQQPVDRALTTLAKSNLEVDLIFVDPPYVRVTTPELLKELTECAAWLTADGILVLEHGKRDPAPKVPGITWEETREYGDTHVSLGSRAH